jgi:oleandomycin transport system ATP-binding protein
LTVRPADRSRLAEVTAILREVTGAQPDSPGRDVASVAVDGDAALAVTVAKLAQAGIAVTELSLHLPSLDEVFFTLTGTRTAETEDAA